MLSPEYTAGSGEGIQPDSSVFDEYARAPARRRPNSSPAVKERLEHGFAVVPGAEELPARLADHAVAQRADGLTRHRHRRRAEEPELGRGAAQRLLDHPHRVRTLHLEAVAPAPSVGAQRAPHVEVDGDVVRAALRVVDDPVERGSSANQVVAVGSEREQDDVSDDVAVGAARHEVLGAVARESVKAVDREVARAV